MSDINIVTFADGTDKEIESMLDAHYNGEIDVSDYWSIGDTRIIHINSINAPSPYANEVWREQDITIVICGFNKIDLADGTGKAAIVCQTREVMNYCLDSEKTERHALIYDGYGYFYDKPKWESTYLREYLNTVIYSAISIKDMIKPVNHKRLVELTLEDSTDIIFLPSEHEVFGDEGTVVLEGDKWEYYSLPQSLIKYGNNNGIPNHVSQNWWLSTPSLNTSIINGVTTYSMRYVNTDGESNDGDGYCSFGLSPAFCL